MATLGVHNTDENMWKTGRGLLYYLLILNYNYYYLLNNLLLLIRGLPCLWHPVETGVSLTITFMLIILICIFYGQK